jgi:hypothetical protein
MLSEKIIAVEIDSIILCIPGNTLGTGGRASYPVIVYFVKQKFMPPARGY